MMITLGLTQVIDFASAEELQSKCRDAWVNCGLDGTVLPLKMTADRPTFMQLWRWGFVVVTKEDPFGMVKAKCLDYPLSVPGTRLNGLP